jgi:hypothetical protein
MNLRLNIVQAQAERLSEYDEELVIVSRVHADTSDFRDTLESPANANPERLKAETQSMNEAVLAFHSRPRRGRPLAISATIPACIRGID